MLTAIDQQIQCYANQHPEKKALVFLQDGHVHTEVTYGALMAHVADIAVHLAEAGLKPGDRALLVYPEGVEFIQAYLGCLSTGIIAVPAPFTGVTQGQSGLARLKLIFEDAQTHWILTNSDSVVALAGIPAQVILTDTIPALENSAYEPIPHSPGDIAHLQYTSGSTRAPRGVMISLGNLAAQVSVMQLRIGYPPGTRVLTWSPHTHDFGLVEGLLTPLASGATVFIMSPWALLRRPVRWLQAISRHQITHSGGAAFAFRICLQIPPSERSELDLSSWVFASVGAEPIPPQVLRDFCALYAPCGFQENSIYPGYGLAEDTLITTGKARNTPFVTRWLPQPGGKPIELTGCGPPFEGTTLSIVNPETRIAVEDGRIGEIWMHGSCVALGYWQKPEETEAVFGQTLATDDRVPSPVRWLRTGDWGIWLDDNLYILGRSKDVIIQQGVNYHAQDIEWSIQASHPALQHSACAVFAITDEHGEHIGALCEIDKQDARAVDLPGLLQAIRDKVAQEHQLSLFALGLVKRGAIFKTTSGKIRRQDSRDAWLNGEFSTLAEWHMHARLDTLTTLEQIAEDALHPHIGCASAFSLLHPVFDRELLILVCELSPAVAAPQPSWELVIREQLPGELNFSLADIRFVPAGWAGTGHEKDRRIATQEKYEASFPVPDSFGVALLSQPESAVTQIEYGLTALFGWLLGTASLSPDANLVQQGIDSLTFVQALVAIETAINFRLPVEQSVAVPTIRNMARLVGTKAAAVAEPEPSPSIRAKFNHQIGYSMSWAALGLAGRVPYEWVVRLHQRWVRLPALRARFHEQLGVLDRWLELLGIVDDAEKIRTNSLMANTWHYWRHRAVRVNARNSYTLEGFDQLLIRSQAHHPTVLIVPHSAFPLGTYLKYRPALRGIAVINTAGPLSAEQNLLVRAYGARQTLSEGGIVVVGGDTGRSGGQPLWVPFLSKERRFHAGYLKMALDFGADLIPVFTRFSEDGRQIVSFMPPLSPDPGAPNRAQSAVQQYADCYTRELPTLLGTLQWPHLRQVWEQAMRDPNGQP